MKKSNGVKQAEMYAIGQAKGRYQQRICQLKGDCAYNRITRKEYDQLYKQATKEHEEELKSIKNMFK